jgi:hypothetical protein
MGLGYLAKAIELVLIVVLFAHLGSIVGQRYAASPVA